ncbi:MAG: metallophosphoesterase [Acetobacteraceae bacterium]|nr:metallophosphoesterase [Acetobacteraceae bacterium]
MNADKREWEGAYLRPSNRRWQTTLVFNDVHDRNCDPFFRRVLLDTIRRVQPEKIVLNGDIFDLPEFSKHIQDPREFAVVERIQWVHALLSDIRAVAPDSEILFVEGNHEFRLLRHTAEQNEALMVVLADLHGFTVPKLLGLEKFEVNFIARADLTAWTEKAIKDELRKNYVILWDSVLFGHFPEMRSMGYPGGNGHHHKHIVWPAYSPLFGPYEWHQLGCGHAREASYCNGERWSNGFLLAHVDTHTRRTQFEYVDVSHTHAIVGGKFYARDENERVLDLAA